MSDEEDKRAQLSADVRLGTLSREENERLMRESYARRSNRDRAREAWRKAQQEKKT